MINQKKIEIQNEAFDALKQNNFRAGVILPTGTGKTLVIIKSLNFLDDCESILYCCDNMKLRDEDFPNELKKWGSEHLLDKMDRLCYQSAYKLRDKHYDVLVCDEGDYMLSPAYIKLLYNNTFKHIIFVSATLDEAKRGLIEELIPIVYEKKMKDIEGTGVVNRAKFYYVPFMLTPEENKDYLHFNKRFSRLLDAEKPNNFLLNKLKTNRKHFLAGLGSSAEVCKKLLKKIKSNPKNKTLIFCTLGSQADIVCEHSHHQGNNNPEYLQLLSDGVITAASIVGKIDRGINLVGINCIIIEAPFNSKTKSTQKTGRARRLDVDEYAHMFYLIPYYRTDRGEIKATIVLNWVNDSTKDLNPDFKTYTI